MQPAILTHFRKKDPIIYSYIHLVSDVEFRVSKTPFVDLVETIINQQLSDKAGATIFGRFKDAVGDISPQAVLELSDDAIRNVGVSWSKVTYIKAIAEAVDNKRIDISTLSMLPDAEIIKTLTAVKGIGRWTAEMFLMFSLGKEDIFSYGDLGLRRGIQKLYGFRQEPTLRQMEKIVAPWAPYRSWAARTLWRYLDAGK